MSLFEQAQKIVSDILEERKKPMLSVSMERMQPIMPMAQGGGLSTVQNSLNINGQPHRLAYINPSEENLLTQLGGSGRKIDGIPSYYSEDADADADNTAANVGIGPGDGSGDPDGITTDTNEEGMTTVGSPTTGGPTFTPPEVFAQRNQLNRSPNKSISFDPFAIALGLVNPTLGFLAKAANLGPSFDISVPNTGTQGGYGDTGNPGSSGNAPGAGEDDGTGGDDGIYADNGMIREQIAAASNRKPEEVTVAEVQEVRETLTNKQRVANTGIKEILDQIYGSGKGAGLLGIPTNNTGTA